MDKTLGNPLDAAEDAAPVQPTVQTDAPQRNHKGQFLAGNRASVMTALRAGRAHLPEVFRVLEDKARDFLDQSITDDGGPGELSERRKSQHAYRASLHLNILRLNAALETHGLFDKRGKLRVLWLDKLSSLIREARATDVLLGLERRTKNISALSPEAYAEAIARTAQQPPHAPAGDVIDVRATQTSGADARPIDAPTEAATED